MTATMEPADARLSASIMISSSLMLLLAGEQVDCTTKQLTPRTFSPISTNTSPSEKVVTSDIPGRTSTLLQIASASSRFPLPLKMVSALIMLRCASSSCSCISRWGGRIRTYECGNQNPVTYRLSTPQENPGMLRKPKRADDLADRPHVCQGALHSVIRVHCIREALSGLLGSLLGQPSALPELRQGRERGRPRGGRPLCGRDPGG